jgi:purine catabolism regulator
MFAMDRVLDRANEGLKTALALQSEIMATVTSTGGLDEILQKTADALPDSAMFVWDFGGNLLCELDRNGELSKLKEAALDVLWRLPELSHGPVRSPAHVDLGSSHKATVWPIFLQGELEAVVVRLGSTPLRKKQEVLLAQGVMGAAFMLTQLGSQRQATRTCVEVLVDALATSTSTNQVVGDRLNRLGLSEAMSYSVACLQACGEAPESLCRRVESALQGQTRFRVGVWESRVYVIACGEVIDAQSLYMALTNWNSHAMGYERTGKATAIKMSVSQIVSDIDGLRAAFWQAHSAVSWDTRDSGILEVTDLNVAAIFAASDPKVRALVIDRILGPLLARDKLDNSQLVETLRVFLDHGCRPGRAASDLFIHRHTLAYRLDRITELTGRDPRDGKHLLEFALAVALTQLDVHQLNK